MNLSAEQFSQILQSLQTPPGDLGKDKRRAARTEHRATLTIQICSDNTDPSKSLSNTPQQVIVRNFSTRGVGILHARPLVVGSQFIIQLLHADGTPMNILCNVQHCSRIHETLYAIGAEFACTLTSQPVKQNAEDEVARIRQSLLAS